MAKRGKRYQAAQELLTKEVYDAAEAFDLVKETATAKFDETIEVHIKLGVDSRHADQQVRGTVVLPHGTGQDVRVLVFAQGAQAEAAEAAGADHVGGAELAEKIQNENWFEFDVVVATPDMMGVVGRLGRVLGPRGLMPNPKAGTVTTDVTTAISDLKSGQIEFRLDRTNLMHTVIGKASFTSEQLLDNYNALKDAVLRAKPSGAKGQFVRSINVSSAMGPNIKLND